MEKAQALTHLITRFPDVIDHGTPGMGYPCSRHCGIPFPRVGQTVQTSIPRRVRGLGRRTPDASSHLRFVHTLDFGVLDGLGVRAAAEIRDTEGALIAFTEAEQKRDALHVKTKQEIAAKRLSRRQLLHTPNIDMRGALSIRWHAHANHGGRAGRVCHRAADRVRSKTRLLAVRLGEECYAISAKAER